jgi:hypothetical protein
MATCLEATTVNRPPPCQSSAMRKNGGPVMLIWDLVPRVSIGPFRFGCPAMEVIERYGLRKLERDCPTAYWETYELPGWESRIMVEDDEIAGVLCCDSCVYNGAELLGLTFAEAREHLGPEDGLGEGIGLGRSAYYARLGLTLWIDEADNIESATCESADEE